VGRYSHFIKPTKAVGFPGCIGTLEMNYSWEPRRGEEREDRAVLTRWCVATCVGKSGHYGKAKIWTGIDAASLWSILRKMASRQRAVWLVTSQVRSIIHLLQLWQVICGGEWRLDRRDGFARRQRNRVKETAQAPLLILEDSVSILNLRHRDEMGSIAMLAASNFGLGEVDLSRDCDVRAGELLSAMRRIMEIIATENLGGPKQTAASQAFHSWRHTHMSANVYVHTNNRALELERRSQYGGRCEAFRRGLFRGNLYHLDYRGLYPHLAATCCAPCCLARTGTGALPRVVGGHRGYTGVIARLRVASVCPTIPTRTNRGVTYRSGEHVTVLCGPELDYHLQHETVKEIYEWAEYRLQPCLATAACHWYRLRCAAESRPDRLVSTWLKACAVGLIGRFAQVGGEWMEEPLRSFSFPYGEYYRRGDNGVVERIRCIDWNEYRYEPQGYTPETCPAITSWITSLGRVRLWTALRHVWPDHVYYCDTDSLMVDEDGFWILNDNGLIREREWGFLTIRETATDAQIWGPKHYRFGKRIVRGGVVRNPDCRFRKWPAL
jgi:hypothetical protein